MKLSFLFSFIVLSIAVVSSSYTTVTIDKPTLQITIQGLEGRDLLKEGVGRTEFALMVINTDQEGVTVSKFEVVLARGSKPIETVAVEAGNRIDLREFADSARSGDRFVVDIKEITGAEPSDNSEHSVVIIPVQ